MNSEHRQTLFIGHGSPMNVIEDNSYTQFLENYSQLIIPPKAIIVISAHWLTKGTFITGAENPPQIYDFYGFPDELYNIKYTPPGFPELAHQINQEIHEFQVDSKRGIDHAAWAVLKHIYPKADIPILEISLDINKSNEEHFNLAKELIKFRKENILFISSGNIIHNLHQISFDTDATPVDWAVEMDHWFKNQIDLYDIEKLLNYSMYIENHRLGIPTTDHYLPLLYTLGMKLPDEKTKTIHESFQNGSLSMRSIEIS